jgi:hypothetical protein
MSAENKSEILANIAKLEQRSEDMERRLDQRQQEFKETMKDVERRLGLLEIASKELTQSMVERMEEIKELEKSAEDIGRRMAEQPKGDEYVSDADLDDVAVELEDDESEKPQPDDVYQ